MNTGFPRRPSRRFKSLNSAKTVVLSLRLFLSNPATPSANLEMHSNVWRHVGVSYTTNGGVIYWLLVGRGQGCC